MGALGRFANLNFSASLVTISVPDFLFIHLIGFSIGRAEHEIGQLMTAEHVEHSLDSRADACSHSYRLMPCRLMQSLPVDLR